MDSKERMMIALERGKPDRLPVTIHQWQKYHLETYMGGMNDLEAFLYTGMDAAITHIQESGQFFLADADFSRFYTPEWRDEIRVMENNPDNWIHLHTIRTPGGMLSYKTGGNRMTTWVMEYLIKHDEDIELIRKYMPVPAHDNLLAQIIYDRVGGAGILRGMIYGNQAGCWQDACTLIDSSELILRTYDNPNWVHSLLGILLEKKLRYIESMAGASYDLIETGGGAASSTLISPKIHKEFCLPYDRKMHDALHALGFKITYHTCGGTKNIEEYIVANGCDATETLAPPSIGGNQEPWEYKAKIDGRLALIGGIDQFNVLTDGSADQIREMVRTLFEKVGDQGGYILSACDHFFTTSVDNLRVYAAAARECVYS